MNYMLTSWLFDGVAMAFDGPYTAAQCYAWARVVVDQGFADMAQCLVSWTL